MRPSLCICFILILCPNGTQRVLSCPTKNYDFYFDFQLFRVFFAQQGELGNHREALKNVLSRAKFSHHAEAFIIN